MFGGNGSLLERAQNSDDRISTSLLSHGNLRIAICDARMSVENVPAVVYINE